MKHFHEHSSTLRQFFWRKDEPRTLNLQTTCGRKLSELFTGCCHWTCHRSLTALMMKLFCSTTCCQSRLVVPGLPEAACCSISFARQKLRGHTEQQDNTYPCLKYEEGTLFSFGIQDERDRARIGRAETLFLIQDVIESTLALGNDGPYRTPKRLTTC